MVELLVNATVAEGKQALGGRTKLALGNGFTYTGIVLVVLLQPLLVVTLRLTWKLPQLLNKCEGFCCVEVLAAPLAGSPKFHVQPVIDPEAAGMVESELLKFTAPFWHTIAS